MSIPAFRAARRTASPDHLARDRRVCPPAVARSREEIGLRPLARASICPAWPGLTRSRGGPSWSVSRAGSVLDVAADGRVSNKRQFARLIELEKGSLGPRSRVDGMPIDAMGRLYVSTAAGIQVLDRAGKHLGIIRLPSVARNVAFGGKDRRTMYLTALGSLYRVQMLAGSTAGRSK